MFSSEEISALQSNIPNSNNIPIVPILLTPYIPSKPSLAIETTQKTPAFPSMKTSHQIMFVEDSSPSAWYLVKDTKLQKFENNFTKWICPFNLKIKLICKLNKMIVVSLENEILYFIDTENGIPCSTPLCVSGGIVHIQSFQNLYLLAITKHDKDMESITYKSVRINLHNSILRSFDEYSESGIIN